MTLQAVDSQSEKRSGSPSCQTNRVKLIVVIRISCHRNEIDSRRVGPQSFVREQVTDQIIVGTIAQNLITQPMNKTAATVHNERSVLNPHVSTSESLGEIVRKPFVFQDVIQPPIHSLRFRHLLNFTNFLQRRNRSGQAKRDTANQAH